jgi:subtilisin family serine protease
MKWTTWLSILALLSLVLAALPAPMAAQEVAPVEHPRAPRPPETGVTAPVTPKPEWGGSWQYGPTTGFQFTRFDGGYYPADGKVYFMGGRLADNGTDGSVWSFDPATGIYADTGVDLVTPISNYQMNLLQDGSGNWGFYVFGGRPAAGGVAAAVQIYYPDSNTAVQLTAADNYPGPSSCTSGLNAVYNNKAYIAGGFDSTTNHAQTWIFDPTAAAGSRWTQLASADLSVARAYIMSAVVDGKIYAIGGNWFDGANLNNVATAEVLDPTAATPVWDDAAVADLPEVCSSSRAWGFDSGSPYADPDGTSLGGKIVSGCGVWATENNHVYVYDTTLDYWEAFPYLLDARRDQAGEFVPSLPVGAQDAGIPAMWVWGGRQGSDTNVLTSSEYYDVPALECDILLVDDDWDFTSTHGGGRPYYTSTLEFLGYPFDVWETESMGTPTAIQMAPYEVVVWFTGYDWQTPISPDEQTELMAYLDSGGNLFASDQEQQYAYPGSTIMSDYFWVDSITEDVVLTGTVGGPADPLFSGLGPYAMGRPDAWDAYWPTGSYEGPYDDEAYVKAGGFEPMIYTADNNPNSTRFQGASFKTVYLAYPFEWLTELGDRAELLNTAITWFCAGGGGEFDLIPPGQVGSGVPGAVVPYTLTLVNNLGYEETFDLTYQALWPTAGEAIVGPVPNGGSEEIVVNVTVPADANCYDKDMAEVIAVPQSTPTISDTAYLDTTAEPPGAGGLSGTVYDANTDLPLANADVALELMNETYFYNARTDADGNYLLEDVPACTYNGRFRSFGYYPLYTPVPIDAGTTSTLDVYLDASMPELSDDAVTVTLEPDSTYAPNVTLANYGTGELHFHISEIPSDAGYPVPMSVPAMPSGVDPQVYTGLSASPDGTGKFIVYLKDQADLSAAFGMEDRSARGHYVLDALQAVAQRSQAGLRAQLDRDGAKYEARYIVNALVVEGSVDMVDRISKRADVAFIGPDSAVPAPAPVEMSPVTNSPDAVVWNVAKVNADDVWSTYGATGEGIVVSNIDTGVMYTHTALVNQYRGNLGGGTFDHNYNWWDPYGDQPNAPYDYHSHGSHTIGTMVGGSYAGSEIGMAPSGQWIACNGFEKGGSGYEAELMECAEFILAPWDLTGSNPQPDMRPDVVNNSWGGGQAQWWYNQAIYAWRAAGIFPTFSIGNSGPNCGTAGDPGDSANVISAGATDSNDNIASFSSRGPAKITNIIKPDVSAPGVGVISAFNNGGIGSMSGTSMASPHVGGEAALLWSAVPELRGDVQLTYWIIEQSTLAKPSSLCGDAGPPNNVYGWGRIDAYNAVSMARGQDWDIPWLVVDPVSGTVPSGNSTDVMLAFDSTGLDVGACYTGTLKFEYNDPYIVEQFVPVELCVASCVGLTDITLSGPDALMAGETGTYSVTLGPPNATEPIDIEWNNGTTEATAEYSWTQGGIHTVAVTATNCAGAAVLTATLDVDVTQTTHYVYLPIVLKNQ